MSAVTRLFLGLFLIAGCGYFAKHHEKNSTTSAIDVLKQRRNDKIAEARKAFDEQTGWPSRDDCDGTLWAGLALAAGVDTVKIDLAEYSPGIIQRRPFVPCWTPETGDNGSKATISRDQLTGYLWALWVKKDLDALRRLYDYGTANNWVMGKPSSELPTVIMGANLTGLLCRMLKADCGLPPTYFPVAADYEYHIQVLDILLQGEVNGGIALVDISGNALDRLKEDAAKYPNDALFAAAIGVYDGDFSKAVELLNSDDYVYPNYVRGSANYKLVHWLIAASIVIKHQA